VRPGALILDHLQLLAIRRRRHDRRPRVGLGADSDAKRQHGHGLGLRGLRRLAIAGFENDQREQREEDDAEEDDDEETAGVPGLGIRQRARSFISATMIAF